MQKYNTYQLIAELGNGNFSSFPYAIKIISIKIDITGDSTKESLFVAKVSWFKDDITGETEKLSINLPYKDYKELNFYDIALVTINEFYKLSEKNSFTISFDDYENTISTL